ncbi:MAG: hypothetical protein N3A58_00695 [Spirochaetes bacterium]|nr:hypothetical protein [Spirochaetota bacterium]
MKENFIFNNEIKKNIVKSAIKQKNKYLKKYKFDSNKNYNYKVENIDLLNRYFKILRIKKSEEINEIDKIKNINGLIVGNIRMGYGHYRISIAIASCASYLGYTPLWFDFLDFPGSPATSIIKKLNDLYSLGSRLSQKIPLFNKLFWEPLTAEGFKKLSYNFKDLKMTELFIDILNGISKEIPFVGTHAWPAQAAVHSGFKKVVNAIPDNWPLGLHLSEGAIHTIQTFSSLYGYSILKNMDKKNKILNPIPEDKIIYTGHYIDHELVFNIEKDCDQRITRINNNLRKRLLFSIGGAGAQVEYNLKLILSLVDDIKKDKVTLFINCGDHKNVFNLISNELKKFDINYEVHNDNNESINFAENVYKQDVKGVHIFINNEIFTAIYLTNILMRSSDILITKPSELAFYPVPKILIQRVGGHEAYGAIHSSEIGDGTIECETYDFGIQAIKLLIERKSLLKLYCENIIKNKSIGIYNGGYEVIKIFEKYF